MRCSLAKTITAPHLIFVVTCAVLYRVVWCGVVWCGLEFSQNHNHTAPHFCGHMCDTMYKMWFEVSIFFKFWAFPTQSKTNFFLFFYQVLNYWASFSLAKTITIPHLIFAVICAILCIRCGLKSVYFSNFGFFLLNPKLIFSPFFYQILNYWASFSLFWVSFSSQYLLGLLNLKKRKLGLLNY